MDKVQRYQQQLLKITKDPRLSNQHKIAQLQSFKILLKEQMTKSSYQKQEKNPQSLTDISQQLSLTYNAVNKKISTTVNKLFSQHQQCVQKLENIGQSDPQYKKALHQMREINQKLSALIKNTETERLEYIKLCSLWEDSLKLKKAKLSFQYEKRRIRSNQGQQNQPPKNQISSMKKLKGNKILLIENHSQVVRC